MHQTCQAINDWSTSDYTIDVHILYQPSHSKRLETEAQQIDVEREQDIDCAGQLRPNK